MITPSALLNPTTHQYDYRIIVHKGTSYPTPEPVARLSVKASYDSQIPVRPGHF